MPYFNYCLIAFCIKCLRRDQKPREQQCLAASLQVAPQDWPTECRVGLHDDDMGEAIDKWPELEILVIRLQAPLSQTPIRDSMC